MKKSNKYFADRLGEIVYTLGEVPFEFINTETWLTYINYNKPFTDKQIEDFKKFLKFVMEDYEILIKAQQDYIKFLGTEIEKYAVSKHYECSEEIYNQGEKLRENIDLARKRYETEN